MAGRKKTSGGSRHSHLFTIADNEAVEVLLDKIAAGSAQQRRREKLLAALRGAVEQYREADVRERKAFFHGMLTGYAVALKLW